MKQNKKHLIYGILAVCAVAVAGFFIAPFLAAAGTGAALAAPFAGAPAEQTIQGTAETTLPGSVTDGFKHPEMNKPSISQKLTKIRPSATPLDTILRELDSAVSHSNEYKYYSVQGRGIAQKVAVATTAGVDGEVVTITLESAHIFSLDGNILVPSFSASSPQQPATPVTSGVSYSPLILHIVNIDRAAKKITVFPVNASAVPAIPANTLMFRMGTAKHELAAISEDPSSQPTSDSNYCQIHMTTVSEGIYQAMQEKEVRHGLLDIKEEALFDFRMTNEVDGLFGYKREIIDPVSQKAKYMSDGMIRKITKHLDKGSASAVTDDVLIGWCADIFAGNNGSEERIMFYGSGFGVDVATAATIQKQLEAKNTEVKFGLTFNRIETVHGVLLMKLHNVFEQYGYSDAAMVIDPANIQRAIQKPLEATTLELDKTGKSRSKDVRIDESHTLAVMNPDTHAMLYSK